MTLTGIAWGIWAGAGGGGVIRLTLIYVIGHFLIVSLLVATTAYFLVGKFLGPGIVGLPGRRRQTGLFIAANERETLEFGYCFDVGRCMMCVCSRLLMGELGFDTSILSGVGIVVCLAVYYIAIDQADEYVGIFWHLVEGLLTITGYLRCSEIPYIWLLWATIQ